MEKISFAFIMAAVLVGQAIFSVGMAAYLKTAESKAVVNGTWTPRTAA